MSGKTGIYDQSTGRVYVGHFGAGNGQTAHQNMLSRLPAGVNPANCVGFSISPDRNANFSGHYYLGMNSRTLNGPGRYAGDSSAFDQIYMGLHAGNYYNVSRAGSINAGRRQHGYYVSHSHVDSDPFYQW